MSPSEIQAGPNANATLPCNVTLPPATDESLIDVSWISNGSEIASFNKTDKNIKNGFSWNVTQFASGDFSLTILGASLQLQGVYKCKVSYNFIVLHSSNITFSILGMSFSCWDLTMYTFEPKRCWFIFPSIYSTSPLLSIPHSLGASAVGGVRNTEPA